MTCELDSEIGRHLSMCSQHAAEMKVAEDGTVIGKLSVSAPSCINQTFDTVYELFDQKITNKKVQ
jgi:hypothetical protein